MRFLLSNFVPCSNVMDSYFLSSKSKRREVGVTYPSNVLFVPLLADRRLYEKKSLRISLKNRGHQKKDFLMIVSVD